MNKPKVENKESANAPAPQPAAPHYSLDELLAQSDYARPLTKEERQWVNGGAVGRELI